MLSVLNDFINWKPNSQLSIQTALCGAQMMSSQLLMSHSKVKKASVKVFNTLS